MSHPTRPEIGQWASHDELRAMRDERLAHLLAHARRSPFYRRHLRGAAWPATAADFRSLPLTGKHHLREEYPFGLLAVSRTELATYHESSGTAGLPTASYYTEDDWLDLAERFARKWVGITAEDTALVRTPYALMITGHLAQAAFRLRGATVVPVDSRSAATPLSRVVRVLHDLDVTLTWSNPTETLLLAAAARAAGYRPEKDFPALRALFVGGEPLSDARRRRISQTWNAPVVEEYGSTETGSLAGQCPAGRLHAWADRAVFEVYRPETGEVADEGSGQLVVTPLHREAMPLLRYNIADDVELSYAPCGCGWHLPTIRVLGRSAFGHPVTGRRVTQDALEELVFGLPAEYDVTFWRARAEPAVLRVELEVPPEWRDAATARLAAAIDRTLHVPCEVTGLPPATLVPRAVLTGQADVLKPRGLFGADEDWDRALLYY